MYTRLISKEDHVRNMQEYLTRHLLADARNRAELYYAGAAANKNILKNSELLTKKKLGELLRIIARGANTTTYLFNLPQARQPLLVKLQSHKPHNLNSLEQQFEIQKKMSVIMKKTPLGQIPEAYAYNPKLHCLTMEYISECSTLPVFMKAATVPEKEFVRQIIEKTLEFWQTGNLGKYLFIHGSLTPDKILVKKNDRNEMTVYITGLETALFWPSEKTVAGLHWLKDRDYTNAPGEICRRGDQDILNYFKNPQEYEKRNW